jgi:uncharacterized protein YukE
MGVPLGVTPAQLRATADHLTDVSTRMAAVLSGLRSRLDGEGRAWGDDKVGREFADGGEGYLAQVDGVDESVGAKTKLLDDYSTLLRTTANTLEQQDQG